MKLKRNQIIALTLLVVSALVLVGVWFAYPWIQVTMLKERIKKGENAEALLPVIDEYSKKIFDKDSANDATAYSVLGVYTSSVGDKNAALWFYGKALQADSKHFETLNNMAVVYEELQNYTRAEELRKRVISLYPGDVRGYRALADLYRDRFSNSEDKIVALMTEGLKATGEHVDLLQWMASYYQEKGEPQKAVPYTEKLVKKLNTGAEKKE